MSNTLLPCPFCGGEAIVVKTERCGRYIGCWDCGGRTEEFETDYAGSAHAKAIAAWNHRAEDGNPPLTLEELRQMDGEPVYIVSGTEGGYWELSVDAEDYFMDRHEEFYGMTCSVIGCQGCSKNNGLHHLGWLAYRYKTKGE